MAKCGNRGKSVAEHQVSGSWRGKNRRNRRDLILPVGRLIVPQWLGFEAKQIWRDIIPELKKAGIVCKIDVFVLARYCDCFSRWKRLAKKLNETGEIVESDSGTKQRPELGVLIKFESMLIRFESVLGLSPAARVGLRIKDTKASNDTKFFDR